MDETEPHIASCRFFSRIFACGDSSESNRLVRGATSKCSRAYTKAWHVPTHKYDIMGLASRWVMQGAAGKGEVRVSRIPGACVCVLCWLLRVPLPFDFFSCGGQVHGGSRPENKVRV